MSIQYFKPVPNTLFNKRILIPRSYNQCNVSKNSESNDQQNQSQKVEQKVVLQKKKIVSIQNSTPFRAMHTSLSHSLHQNLASRE